MLETVLKRYLGGGDNILQHRIVTPEPYLEPCQISAMKHFLKIINSFKPLTIFQKSSTVDLWQGPKYGSGNELILSYNIDFGLFWNRPGVEWFKENYQIII